MEAKFACLDERSASFVAPSYSECGIITVFRLDSLNHAWFPSHRPVSSVRWFFPELVPAGRKLEF
ncbi:MAG TPA: hypothetical protein PKY96_01640 [Flavobacteriales bacterium]|nr:hypothetical protein [Flavobacteriales bacterium]